jgi:hypothetical protein
VRGWPVKLVGGWGECTYPGDCVKSCISDNDSGECGRGSKHPIAYQGTGGRDRTGHGGVGDEGDTEREREREREHEREHERGTDRQTDIYV